jgi:hypothetical protein
MFWSILFVNCPYSVTNTKCEPNIICHSLKKNLGIIDLQCCNYCHLHNNFPSKFILSMTICQCKNVLDVENIKLCFNNWHSDELKVSWDDSYCKVTMET